MLSASFAAILLVVAPDVRWAAPAECPDKDRLLAEASRLGADLGQTGASISGRIDAAPEGFELDLRIENTGGSTDKRIAAPDCEILVGAAALMIAVALDPVATAAAIKEPDPAPALDPLLELPEPVAEAPTRPAPGDRSVDDSPPVRDTPSRRPVRGFGRASGSVGRSIVPGLDGRVGLGAGVLWGHLRAELIGFHVFRQEARYSMPSSAGVAVWGWGAAARAGGLWEVGPVELHALAGVSLAAVTGAGFGTTRNTRETDLWIAVAAIPGVRVPAGPWVALGLDVDVEVAVRPPAFRLAALEPVHRSARVGGSVALVIELRFPRRIDQSGPSRRRKSL